MKKILSIIFLALMFTSCIGKKPMHDMPHEGGPESSQGQVQVELTSEEIDLIESLLIEE